MEKTTAEIIGRFSGLRALVIGDAIVDTYIEGAATGISREAPVPIVAVRTTSYRAGGAANTAVNVQALGADASLLSLVGDDDPGGRLLSALAESGISSEDVVIEPGRRTLNKTRVSADGQALLRFDEGGADLPSAENEAELVGRLGPLFAAADLVMVSDYGQGVLTAGLVAELGRLQASNPRVLVVDARDLPRYSGAGVTAVKPNYEEAIHLLGLPPATSASERLLQVGAAGDRLLDITGSQVAAVTLDSAGGLVFERGSEPYRTYTRNAPSSRAAGAGDTFAAALALALAAGASTPAASEIAAAAAAVVVGKERTAACSAAELLAFFSLADKYVTDLDGLVRELDARRWAGARLVFTNGCFDILHSGHITYLNRAKALGDILVVGLNSDESTARLKGPDRPINTLEDRAQVLSALSCVDHIIPFWEDTPAEIIRAIRPDLFVKGGDYTRETLPEAELVEELGGHVQILPYLEARSTSAIIERIRSSTPLS
ncbi:MAG: D-glycero-beta-D-manno-heptose 1-phosphate adenylyltransferase [Dehalococcoidia bacterium]